MHSSPCSTKATSTRAHRTGRAHSCHHKARPAGNVLPFTHLQGVTWPPPWSETPEPEPAGLAGGGASFATLGDRGPALARTPSPRCLQSSHQDTLWGVCVGGLVARTTAPHLCLGTKGQPGGPRTACSFSANVTGTSQQLALGGPGHPRQGLQCGGGGCSLEGPSSWEAAPRPLSFCCLLTRKSARSASRASL